MDYRMRRGDRVGEYELLEPLGQGGFGEVWKARNPDLPDAVVAVKVPTDSDYLAALRREGAMQHTLSHPNIVKVLSLNTASEPPYLVMEYVYGESLRQRLDRERRFAPDKAIQVLEQVLEALHAAHRAGVVHCDVKPGNVLLASTGVVKLGDFGLGRATAAASIELSRSRSGKGVTGTYHYMAPEQMRGEAADARSDLYACGVMLYEMLTGEAHPIRLPVPGAPTSLSAVVDRALSSDPAARFQDARGMSRSLREAPRGPVVVPPPPPPPVTPRVRQAAPEASPTANFGPALGCAIVLVVVAATGLYYWKLARSREQAEAASRLRGPGQVVGFETPTPRPSVSELCTRAAGHLAEKRLTAAEMDYTEALLQAPNSTQALLGRAKTLAALEQRDQALADFDRLLELDASIGEAWLGRGTVLAAKADAEKLGGGDPRGLYARALNDFACAAKELIGAPEPFESEGQARCRVAEYELEKGLDPRETLGLALSAYDHALDARPDRVSVLRGRAYTRVVQVRVLAGMGEDATEIARQSIADYDAACARSPQDAGLFLERGNAWSELARCEAVRGADGARDSWERALGDYEAAVGVDPQAWNAHLGRAFVLEELGRFPEAVQAYDDVLRIMPGMSPVDEWRERARQGLRNNPR